MHNYSDQTTTGGPYEKQRIRQNFSTLADYVTFDHNNIWVPGPLFTDSPGTATTVSIYNVFPARWYADIAGANSVTHFCFRRPKMWLNGMLTARIHWTGDTSSTNNIVFSVQFFTVSEGDSLGSPGGGSISQLTEAGPTTAYDYKISRAFEDSDANILHITSVVDLIEASFGRTSSSASDTYLGSMGLLGVELMYTENSGYTGFRRRAEYGRMARK